MGKIIETIIKNWKLILIGIVITTSIVITIILLTNKENQINPDEIDLIQSPYFLQTENMNIELNEVNLAIPGYQMVYKVVGDNEQLFINFFNKFRDTQMNVNMYEDIYMTFGGDTVSYSPNSKILMVIPSVSLSLMFKITSVEDVKMFFQEYFGIDEIVVSEAIPLGENINYEGKYVFNNVEIGSVYLKGYSFILEINELGELSKLSVLLLNQDNVKGYQDMPLSNISSLIENKRYPRMVIHNTIENRFYNQNPLISGSAKLTDYFVEDVSLEYIFNDSQNGYILPTYVLEGEGRLTNSKGEKFWTDTNIFICAISPSYLIDRELEEGEEFSQPVAPDIP